MWRPDNWENPYNYKKEADHETLSVNSNYIDYEKFKGFEAGADAMLEGLKKQDNKKLREDSSSYWLVVIPEEGGYGYNSIHNNTTRTNSK